MIVQHISWVITITRSLGGRKLNVSYDNIWLKFVYAKFEMVGPLREYELYILQNKKFSALHIHYVGTVDTKLAMLKYN